MSAKDKIISAADPSGQVVASMPRDQLRSMFYLFSGKPDSRIKVFDGALYLRPADITELNACVVRKLNSTLSDSREVI